MRSLPDRAPAYPALAATPSFAAEPSTLSSLDDLALLGLLLGRCLSAPMVGATAEALVDRFGSLGDIAAAEVAELGRLPGMGPAAILDLKLLRELSVRLSRTTACARPVLSSWNALTAYARTTLAHLPREQFRTLFLDRRNHLLRDELVADGTVDHAPVYPREVVRRALELSSSAIILVHNHPSGDPTPSRADIEMTRQVIQAGLHLNVEVHDHLVVGRHGVASFKQLGLM